jgi:hypothetical protein
MSDFDTVLERLIGDAGFKAHFAADPASALSGYQLSADELELLRSQYASDSGGQHQVEQRTSKASLFGLLSPLSGMGSVNDAAGGAGAGAGAGHVSEQYSSSSHYSHTEFHHSSGAHATTYGAVGQGGSGHGLLGGVHVEAEPPGQVGGADGPLHGANLEQPGGYGGLNAAPADVSSAPTDQAGLSAAAEVDQGGQGQGGFGVAPVGDYHARVDVQGDGKWDAHTYSARADGGVDINVDLNRDGRADFVGVDHDRDGLIDESYMDHNHDGTMDAHYMDTNHDGWLDKKAPLDRTQGSTYRSRHAVEPEEGLNAAD